MSQELRELRRANDIFRKASAFSRRIRSPLQLIVDFIDDHRDEFGVEPICNVLQFAPSTYRTAKRRELSPSPRAVRDAAMMQVLMVLWVTNCKV